MNYTRPEDDSHKDSPSDWLAGALLFARALGLVLKEGEGVVVDAKGDAKHYFDDSRLVVANIGDQIQVMPASSFEADLSEVEEGQYVMVHEVEESEEKSEETDE